MLDYLALARTKQVRPDTLGYSGPIEAHLAFADIVAEEIICEGTDLLEKIIPRMFEVMYRVAKISCDYVKYGRWS